MTTDAPESGAAVFTAPEPLRAAGNCVHLTCSAGSAAARQWWCYRPRDYDDGTLSLLHEWEPNPRPARRRWGVLASRPEPARAALADMP